MSIQYRYFGILKSGDTPDNPSGVIRVSTDDNGFQVEETYTFHLTWQRSYEFLSSTRPTSDRIVEIDESVVGPFLARVEQLHGDPGS